MTSDGPFRQWFGDRVAGLYWRARGLHDRTDPSTAVHNLVAHPLWYLTARLCVLLGRDGEGEWDG